MTDDAIEPPPPDSVLSRLLHAEERMTAMERAMRKAFGERWMDEQKKKDEGSDGE